VVPVGRRRRDVAVSTRQPDADRVVVHICLVAQGLRSPEPVGYGHQDNPTHPPRPRRLSAPSACCRVARPTAWSVINPFLDWSCGEIAGDVGLSGGFGMTATPSPLVRPDRVIPPAGGRGRLRHADGHLHVRHRSEPGLDAAVFPPARRGQAPPLSAEVFPPSLVAVPGRLFATSASSDNAAHGPGTVASDLDLSLGHHPRLHGRALALPSAVPYSGRHPGCASRPNLSDRFSVFCAARRQPRSLCG